MIDSEINKAITDAPLESTSTGDVSFTEEVACFKKVCVDEGRQYYQYLVIRREDLQLLCSTLRATFGGDCLDPIIKWREWT